MKTKRTLFIVMIFVLAFTAACGGGGDAPAPPAEVPAEAPPAEEPAPAAVEINFPLPDDVDPGSVMDTGNGSINFQTTLSIPDVVTFYRFAFPDYTEREAITNVEDAAFSIVFDGHESGQAIVIQGFSMDSGVNVNIRLEDI
jgi:hypothetical protein